MRQSRRSCTGRTHRIANVALLLVACALAAAPPPSAAAPPAGTAAGVHATAAQGAAGTAAGATAAQVGGLEAVWAIDGAPDRLSFVRTLALGPQGHLYALENGNDRVRTFDRDGRPLAAWGGRGTGESQFILFCALRHCPPACSSPAPCDHQPGALAVDGAGWVYVADFLGRIQVFDGDGHLLATWGGKGAGEGRFDAPVGMAVDAEGHVYVADGQLPWVQKLDRDGRFLLQWGGRGEGEGQFVASGPIITGPTSVAVDAEGSVYVGDARRVQKFDGAGGYLQTFGGPGTEAPIGFAAAVAVAGRGDVWVLDNPGRRVWQFDASGGLRRAWGTSGSGPGQFTFPRGLAVDGDGHLYVSDLPAGAVADTSRIQKLRPGGPRDP